VSDQQSRGTEGLRLSIAIGESDRLGGRPLADVIVREARSMGLPGATVLRGVAGYGARSVLHTSRILRLSDDLPVIIEVIDVPYRIDAFADRVESLLDDADCGGLVTTEPVTILRYRGGPRSTTT
jgi:PII-like signaling protein